MLILTLIGPHINLLTYNIEEDLQFNFDCYLLISYKYKIYQIGWRKKNSKIWKCDDPLNYAEDFKKKISKLKLSIDLK